MRKEERKNYRFVLFLPDAQQKIPKKIAKKQTKIKNTIMASFQAKIVWKWQKKRENTNYRFASLLPEALFKIARNSKN